MSDSFLETDEILQSLVVQLEKFKAASEQLTLAEENAGDLVDACDELVNLCKQLIERNKEQLDATVKLAHDTEQRTNLMIDAQQTFAALTEEKLNALASTNATNGRVINNIVTTLETRGKQLDTVELTLQNDIGPLLQRLKSVTGITRLIAFFLLALLLVNGALAVYIVRLLTS